MRLAVYGSLKKGQWLHYLLESEGINYLGNELLNGYKIFHNPNYNYPAVKYTGKIEDLVSVEVYNINIHNEMARKSLKHIDVMEVESGYILTPYKSNRYNFVQLYVMPDGDTLFTQEWPYIEW